MLNIEKFAKVLALAGSNIDGEALSALRKAQNMLAHAGLSFTDVAQSVERVGPSPEVERLRDRLRQAETDLAHNRREIEDYRQKLNRLQRDAARAPSRARAPNLKRSLAEIEVRMRAVLGDPQLSGLSDREIARRTGVSPQAVGNWRRRLAAGRPASRRASRSVHDGQRSRSRPRRAS